MNNEDHLGLKVDGKPLRFQNQTKCLLRLSVQDLYLPLSLDDDDSLGESM